MAKKKISFTGDYSKPNEIDIVLKENGEFPMLETVIHSLMDTLGFKRNGGEIDSYSVTFRYKRKNKKC